MVDGTGAVRACPATGRHGAAPTRSVPPVAGTGVDPEEVADFFDVCRELVPMPDEAWRQRVAAVRREVAETGTYEHTPAELTAGAKLAWRNHTRCVGKLYWRSLTVLDRRSLRTPTQLRDALLDHLRWAGNGGQIRPAISVFAPDRPGQPGPRVRNRQLVGYAGHARPDGTVLGDRSERELTDLAGKHGWAPDAPGPFDLLPLMIETADGTIIHDVPPELALEVPLGHPSLPGLGELELRWYGFPTVSDMTLLIGGIRYPLAPFTGWYVAPEISARDLTDPHRYGLLERIGTAFGLDTASALWRDRTLVELTAAVLWSFEQAGVRIDDHHIATNRFHRYTQAERRHGREVEAEWAWMIPPISASATPVFHERYSNRELLPNFVRDREA
jgi:nitric-oxide synthase